MEWSSLDALLMDISPPTWPLCLPSSQQHYEPLPDEECGEELGKLLLCASMELKSAEMATVKQGKVYEEKTKQLREELKAAKRERDAARSECRMLKQRIISWPLYSNATDCSKMMAASSMERAEGLSCTSLQQLSPIDSSSSSMQHHAGAPPPHSDCDLLPWKAMGLRQSEPPFEPHIDMQISTSKSRSSSLSSEGLDEAIDDAPPVFELDVLNELNRGTVEALNQPRTSPDNLIHINPASNKIAAGFSKHSHGIKTDVNLEVLKELNDNMMETCNQSQSSPIIMASNESIRKSVAGFSRKSYGIRASANSHVNRWSHLPESAEVDPQVTLEAVPEKGKFLQAVVDARFSKQSHGTKMNSKKSHGTNPCHYLPEPPEADPQVMLRALPQKGKLLQAVVHAGPLLQTLLLAGPLPQWTHPPSALLKPMEIPTALTSNMALKTPPGSPSLSHTQKCHISGHALHSLIASPPDDLCRTMLDFSAITSPYKGTSTTTSSERSLNRRKSCLLPS